MDESRFWEIANRAHTDGALDLDIRVASLSAQLTKLPLTELQSYQSHYDTAIKWAYRWDLWGAAHIINGECSSDGFRYFLDWLVSEGRETYRRALESPDTLADLPPIAHAESELFGYVALQVFESKSTERILLDKTVEAWPPAGEEWVEEDLPLLLPRLSALYKSWDWLQKIRRAPVMGDVYRMPPGQQIRPHVDDGFRFDE